MDAIINVFAVIGFCAMVGITAVIFFVSVKPKNDIGAVFKKTHSNTKRVKPKVISEQREIEIENKKRGWD